MNRDLKNRLGSLADFEEERYSREKEEQKLQFDFMKFAYERRNNVEESKRPLDPPIDYKKDREDDDERAEMKIL